MCNHQPKCIDRQTHIRKLQIDYNKAPIYHLDQNTLTKADIAFVIRFEKDQLKKELSCTI